MFYHCEFYVTSHPDCSIHGVSNDTFKKWANGEIDRNDSIDTDVLFGDFYQYDTMYKTNKAALLEYMKAHTHHGIVTDGITAGDGQNETFYIKDLLDSPAGFSKYYDVALHIRLDDYIAFQRAIHVSSILAVLNKIVLTPNSCIVVQSPTTEYEKNYIDEILRAVYDKYQFHIAVESNDTLTDYHIMKNARILVCSMSTLSWAAAFLSSSIEKCYFPDHSDDRCKSPIDNTELYDVTYDVM